MQVHGGNYSYVDTRIVAGIGVPRITAIAPVADIVRNANIPRHSPGNLARFLSSPGFLHSRKNRDLPPPLFREKEAPPPTHHRFCMDACVG
jgi:hypothetical protein